MRIALGIATIVLMTGATGWYVFLIIRKKIEPAPATWILAAIAMNLSFAAYWDTPKHTWLGNIGNLTAGVSIVLVLATLLETLRRQEKLRVAFDWVQKSFLAGAFLVFIYWQISDRPGAAFWCVQSLLVISYMATVAKAIKLRKNKDSLLFWWGICLASVFGLGPAMIDSDAYGIANSIRAIASSSITGAILLRLEFKNGRFANAVLPRVSEQARE